MILVQMDDRWLLHKFEIAVKEVNEYKKHIVRAIHQDRAKADLIEKLSPAEALLIFDFAMKFLPQKFREAQTDFFAKKGLFITDLEKDASGMSAAPGIFLTKIPLNYLIFLSKLRNSPVLEEILNT